jgi:replicative DNA helicase
MEKYYNISCVPYERVSKERILTGFKDLDYFTKGLEVGVTLLVANSNVGKSTFVQGVLARAIEQGYKVWNFSGEHTAQSFLQLLYHQNSQRKDYVPIAYKNWKGEDTSIVDWYVTEERESEIKAKFDGNLFIYSNKAKRDIDTMIDSMISCHKEQGARFFIVDNMISIDNISSNVFAEQTAITEKIRTFALNYNCIVLLVAHQRKSEKGSFLIDIQDVAGSQNISNKAYNVIAQYRVDMLNKESKDYETLTKELAKCGFDINKCDGVLSVIKTKGNSNGYVGLVYNSETKTYTQAPKISQTEADKIFKVHSKQEKLNIDIQDMDEDDIVEIDGDLPF